MIDAGLDAAHRTGPGAQRDLGSSGAGGGSAAATSYFAVDAAALPARSRLPRKDTVVFECDRGAHFGDAPRYLYERLVERTAPAEDLLVQQHHAAADRPANAQDQAALADLLLGAVPRALLGQQPELPGRPGQADRHPVPADLARHPAEADAARRAEVMVGRDEGYQARAARLTSYWDLLLSGSPYATQCFRSAFR